MSYARWSVSSAVYVFADVSGGVTCCGCLLLEDGSGHYFDADSLIDHMREHHEAGHQVPSHLFHVDTYEPSDFDRDRKS